VSTGDVLLEWTSNDDTVNDSTAPHKRLRIWVPDPAVLDDEPGPDPPPVTEGEPAGEDSTPESAEPEQSNLPGIDAFPWEWYGLSKDDAIAKAEAEDRDWRIGREDGETFAHRDDLVDRRVTFCFDDGVVTSATVESTDGVSVVAEGADDPEDLPYVGLSEDDAFALAGESRIARVLNRDGHDQIITWDIRPERLNFTIVATTVVHISRG
jgi:hypothetical protein